MPDPHADFTWGVATSAYQIEGGRHEDHKGDSIWDRFADEGRIPGVGEVGCDHYHRWPEDVRLMAELGVTGYRFSIAWARVLPRGRGEVNPAGLGFYDRLVDALLEVGIEPWPTLYHWDLPQALQDEGGWPERATAELFAEYVDVVSSALGDRVRNWITHNEPWVAAFAGHRDGFLAPGLTGWDNGLRAAHHLLLSHGRAVPVLRANASAANVGIALDCRPARPATPTPADEAAQRHFDGFRNRWFFDPVFGKGYPEDMVEAYRERHGFDATSPDLMRPGDMDAIGASIDFLGLNYYTSLRIAAGGDDYEDTGVAPGPDPPPGHTEMGWPVTPEALTEFLVRVRDDYGPSQILITENGASYSDGPADDGGVHDDRRIAYLRSHIDAVAAARRAGVPVTGHFAWSLLDNLEWVHGYGQRFGLVWVDHSTGRRIPKDSFHWYRELIAADGPPQQP